MKLISMSIICASLSVRSQPSLRFHVEAWLPFRNCEMDYQYVKRGNSKYAEPVEMTNELFRLRTNTNRPVSYSQLPLITATIDLFLASTWC